MSTIKDGVDLLLLLLATLWIYFSVVKDLSDRWTAAGIILLLFHARLFVLFLFVVYPILPTKTQGPSSRRRHDHANNDIDGQPVPSDAVERNILQSDSAASLSLLECE